MPARAECVPSRTFGHGSRAGLVLLRVAGVWFPAEKPSDPVRALPLLLVAVARKSPAAQLKADDVGRWAGTAANSAVLACWSFHSWHVSPLARGLGSPVIRNRKRNFNSIDMNASTYYEMLQEEFRRLHGLGWTFRQIAESLGISERTVTAWREELDLPRRPRGRRSRKSRR